MFSNFWFWQSWETARTAHVKISGSPGHNRSMVQKQSGREKKRLVWKSNCWLFVVGIQNRVKTEREGFRRLYLPQSQNKAERITYKTNRQTQSKVSHSDRLDKASEIWQTKHKFNNLMSSYMSEEYICVNYWSGHCDFCLDCLSGSFVT